MDQGLELGQGNVLCLYESPQRDRSTRIVHVNQLYITGCIMN